MNSRAYLVVGCKSWNRRVFHERIARLPGRWEFVGERSALTSEYIRALNPRYIFFLHWSWKIPAEIISEFDCVCFHMTDVPYGRGGSPLQNLIVRGHRETKLTALRMTAEFDAGPVYLKQPLSLAGSAEEILIRASELSAIMIAEIVKRHPKPQRQRGKVTLFKRRKPEESAIPIGRSIDQVYDFIRMLDAEGYPNAFIDHGGHRYEFVRATRRGDRVVAEVTIRPLKANS